MATRRRQRSRTPLTGRTVLITGAARGIGAELARRAAARGARVALVGLEPEQLAGVAAELGPEHLWVEADVTDAGALRSAVQRTVDTFGGLDIVVANAGIAPLTTVMTSSAHALARTIEVVAERIMLKATANQVPQLERDIAALDGQEFGRTSVGNRSKGPVA
ncbi:MAG TPA: SDR family NAD(P)-dependent oxidoreductase [Blastococcus sp.]